MEEYVYNGFEVIFMTLGLWHETELELSSDGQSEVRRSN